MSEPAYEAAREALAEKLRSVDLHEDADELLTGNLMRVQTWVVLDMIAALSGSDLRG